MPNETAKVAMHHFQQKLAAFKTKVQFQQLLAQSLTVEFEALTAEFESLQQLFGVSLPEIGVTSTEFGVTSDKFESLLEKIGVTSGNFDVTSLNFGVTSIENESTSQKNGVTSSGFDSSSQKFDVTSEKSGVTSPDFGVSLQNDGASSPVKEMSALIRRSAGTLKIYFGLPNIPDRMAQIVLALKERKKLAVAEMMQLTGASKNSLGRDIRILKQLGWVEFHGSRKNGYFTLTGKFPG